MSHVTTHVLDATTGAPAVGVGVALHAHGADGPVEIARTVTDVDGRVADLGPDALEPGTYQVKFDTGGYFSAQERATFYPEVVVTFAIAGPEHYHVPLLLSPFGYSTYRGS